MGVSELKEKALENQSEFSGSDESVQNGRRLLLASFLALYFELLVIRYLATEIRMFAYLKNLPLIASFLGIGIGMTLGSRTRDLRKAFPGLATFLFLMIWAVTQVGANRIGLPNSDYGIWNNFETTIFSYFAFVGGFLYIVVRFFIPLGGMVGEYMAVESARPLRAYGVNLLGSFAGIAAFTLLSFLGTPPWVWLLLGFALLLPMVPRSYLTVGLLTFTVVLSAVSVRRHFTHETDYWSPYYHIIFSPPMSPRGTSTPAFYILDVNYDYHQKILNLSKDFVSQHPDVEPNRTGLLTYDLPFKLAPGAADVLVVGAGTGNDVAAALRNGAKHVDAVEIDPTILKLGRRFHPEHPYASDRVSTHVNDARAFFKQTHQKYDLVIFAYLDSHTMFSSFSSLRLDNYVYTKESFEDARALLKPGGSMVLAFASGTTLITQRLFRTLEAAFGEEPRVLDTGYDGSGMVFVEGGARTSRAISEFNDVTAWAREPDYGVTTDSWPFLYLRKHRIPWPVWSVLLIFLAASFVAVNKVVSLEHGGLGSNLHFFLLGAAFLLLETKSVTELSLLFGSTWAVNSVVIGAFLCMALISNLLVMRRPVGYLIAYAGLLTLAVVNAFFAFHVLNSYPLAARIIVAGLLTASPVFFSGMVFSRSLSQSGSPNQALGVNLIGAILGGCLESTVMIGGTAVLGPLVILLYVGSAVPLIMGKRTGRIGEQQPAV